MGGDSWLRRENPSTLKRSWSYDLVVTSPDALPLSYRRLVEVEATTLNSCDKHPILGDPGTDSGGEGKSKQAEKYGTKKSKERREESLGTMSYQTSSKRSPPFCLLIGARKLLCFSAQSEGRTVATIWNWSGKTLSPGALPAVLYYSLCNIFQPV